MGKLVLYFLFSATLFLGILFIQKDNILPQPTEVVESELSDQCNFIGNSLSNFSTNKLHTCSNNYLDYNKESIQDNSILLIGQSIRSNSAPTKIYKISFSYRVIKLISSFSSICEQRECVKSIIYNNISKYTSGYYLFSLSKIII